MAGGRGRRSVRVRRVVVGEPSNSERQKRAPKGLRQVGRVRSRKVNPTDLRMKKRRKVDFPYPHPVSILGNIPERTAAKETRQVGRVNSTLPEERDDVFGGDLLAVLDLEWKIPKKQLHRIPNLYCIVKVAKGYNDEEDIYNDWVVATEAAAAAAGESSSCVNLHLPLSGPSNYIMFCENKVYFSVNVDPSDPALGVFGWVLSSNKFAIQHETVYTVDLFQYFQGVPIPRMEKHERETLGVPPSHGCSLYLKYAVFSDAVVAKVKVVVVKGKRHICSCGCGLVITAVIDLDRFSRPILLLLKNTTDCTGMSNENNIETTPEEKEIKLSRSVVPMPSPAKYLCSSLTIEASLPNETSSLIKGASLHNETFKASASFRPNETSSLIRWASLHNEPVSASFLGTSEQTISVRCGQGHGQIGLRVTVTWAIE